MELGLQRRKAIVTGATRGIGRKLAERLADEGCELAICARGEDGVRETVAALKSRGVSASGAALNVRDAAAYRRWLAAAGDTLSGLDIFVAGVSGGTGMDSERNWYRNFEIDVMGAVRGCECILPFLRRSDAAAIVFMADAEAAETFAAPSAYNALNAALIVYAKQLSQAERGIRVNVVSPGPTMFEGSRWDMLERADPKLYNAALRRHPARRMGTVDEIADSVLFLVSPAASWMSGSNLLVDGGFSRRVPF